MGEAFYKLACLYALKLVHDQVRTSLGPIQFAFSSGGPESALHILQAAIELHPDWVIISTDISNAFNTRSRPDILSSLFNTPESRFISSLPPCPLVIWIKFSSATNGWRGKLAADYQSCEGVRQGDVLGSLLFSLSMSPSYAACIQGTDCHAVAVVDDFYILGPPDQAYGCFDIFKDGLPRLLLNLNLPKCISLLPDNPTEDLIHECTSRNLQYSAFSIPALGSILSRDPKIISDWLLAQVHKLHQPFFKALLDPRLPAQHAFTLLRTCMVPRMNYWSRTTSPSTFAPAAQEFDKLVLETFLRRINLDADITDEARNQLSLPVRDGGFGLTSVALVSPAAWYSAFAQAFSRFRKLLVDHNDLQDGIPFVQTLTNCFHFFGKYKFPKGSPVVLDIKQFWSDFEQKKCPRGAQRLIMAAIYKARAGVLLKMFPHNSTDRARLTALSAPFAGSWLTTPPIDPLFYLPDTHFALASRIRLGVTLFDNVKRCVCGASTQESPLHFMSCRYLNASRIIRHDKMVQTISRIARLSGVSVHLEPKIDDEDRARGDGHLFFHAQSATLIP